MEKNSQNDNNQKDPRKKQMIITLIATAVIIFLFMMFTSMMYEDATTKEITYNEFMEQLEAQKIEKVEFTTGGKIIITPKNAENTLLPVTYVTVMLNDDQLIQDLKDGKYGNVEYVGKIESTRSGLFTYIITFVLIYGIFFWFIRKRRCICMI